MHAFLRSAESVPSKVPCRALFLLKLGTRQKNIKKVSSPGIQRNQGSWAFMGFVINVYWDTWMQFISAHGKDNGKCPMRKTFERSFLFFARPAQQACTLRARKYRGREFQTKHEQSVFESVHIQPVSKQTSSGRKYRIVPLPSYCECLTTVTSVLYYMRSWSATRLCAIFPW